MPPESPEITVLSIPPQLIGNAAIPMALQSPRRAIQVLGNRMPVYIAWADRYQGDGAGLAKWSRKELGRPTPLTEADIGGVKDGDEWNFFQGDRVNPATKEIVWKYQEAFPPRRCEAPSGPYPG
jgi:hypothetical protein